MSRLFSLCLSFIVCRPRIKWKGTNETERKERGKNEKETKLFIWLCARDEHDINEAAAAETAEATKPASNLLLLSIHSILSFFSPSSRRRKEVDGALTRSFVLERRADYSVCCSFAGFLSDVLRVVDIYIYIYPAPFREKNEGMNDWRSSQPLNTWRTREREKKKSYS